MRSVVDLPQPEGPTNTTNSRSAMSRLKSGTARTPSSVMRRLEALRAPSSAFLRPKRPFLDVRSLLG